VVLVLLSLQKALMPQLQSQNFQAKNFKVNVSVLAKLNHAMTVAATVADSVETVVALVETVAADSVAIVAHEETPGNLI
jgi:hypothetical protein